MTKMAHMPIYDKNPLKIFFSRTKIHGSFKEQKDIPMHLYGENIEKSNFWGLLKADVSYLAHILY